MIILSLLLTALFDLSYIQPSEWAGLVPLGLVVIGLYFRTVALEQILVAGALFATVTTFLSPAEAFTKLFAIVATILVCASLFSLLERKFRTMRQALKHPRSTFWYRLGFMLSLLITYWLIQLLLRHDTASFTTALRQLSVQIPVGLLIGSLMLIAAPRQKA